MKLYQVVELIKHEYDAAVKEDSLYWEVRTATLGELLDTFNKHRIKPYKSCKYCVLTDRGCRDCFS